MSSVEQKQKVEQKRVVGRNMHEVATLLVDKYHSGNGWRVKKVIPTVLSLEVILERAAIETVEATEVDTEVKTEVVTDEKKVEEKDTTTEVKEETPKTPAKKSTTTAKKPTAAEKKAAAAKKAEDK